MFRLVTYDLEELQMEGDGNCQVWLQRQHVFLSLSDFCSSKVMVFSFQCSLGP